MRTFVGPEHDAKRARSAPPAKVIDDERLERAADRVADEAMGSPRALAPTAAGRVVPPTAGLDGVGLGQPLREAERQYFEPRLGWDLRNVRVHTESESPASVGARAYTLGSNIVFGAGQLASGTSAGRQLLAHELAHVQQQAMGAAKGIQRDALTEQEIDNLIAENERKAMAANSPAEVTELLAEHERLLAMKGHPLEQSGIVTLPQVNVTGSRDMAVLADAFESDPVAVQQALDLSYDELVQTQRYLLANQYIDHEVFHPEEPASSQPKPHVESFSGQISAGPTSAPYMTPEGSTAMFGLMAETALFVAPVALPAKVLRFVGPFARAAGLLTMATAKDENDPALTSGALMFFTPLEGEAAATDAATDEALLGDAPIVSREEVAEEIEEGSTAGAAQGSRRFQPGRWVKVTRSTEIPKFKKGLEAQAEWAQAQGRGSRPLGRSSNWFKQEEDTISMPEYEIDGTSFDGAKFDRFGNLQALKEFKSDYTGAIMRGDWKIARSLRRQARTQLAIADDAGVPLEWHVIQGQEQAFRTVLGKLADRITFVTR